MTLTIFPAIDLRRGQVVRLRQGDAAAQTVYGDDPAAVAKQWAGQGARWLHVVNLDGALTPRPSLLCAGEGEAGESLIPRPPFLCAGEGETDGAFNLRRLAEIRAAVDVPIQFGGGLRTADDVAAALRLGATRVVLGTAAVRRPQVVADAVARFGAAQIVVGIDARDGWVATHGWQETSALDVLTVARRMAGLGVLRVVFTDIARDGMLTGVNVAASAELARASGLRVIASGGVASLDDIRALLAHETDGIEGVIIGQALYTGAVDLAESIAVGQ